MKKHQNTLLTKWFRATENLAQMFSIKYFGKDATEQYWISDEVGGVYAINDYFFSLNDMVEFISNDYPKYRMFEYYDYALTLAMKDEKPINIKNWKKTWGL